MVSDSTPAEEETGSDDSREQGVDLGSLADELESHSYPTTNSELIDEYGDHEVELPDGSESLGEILGTLEGEDQEYDDAEEVRQMIYNLVGAEAVGREGYSDRGGSATDGEPSNGGDEEDESF